MINYGQVAIGTTARKRILVENTGYNPLSVAMITFNGERYLREQTLAADVAYGAVLPQAHVAEAQLDGQAVTIALAKV